MNHPAENTISPDADQKARVRGFFDKDPDWQGDMYGKRDDHYGHLIVRRKHYNLEMLRRIPDLQIGRVLDAGCASGVYMEELLSMGFEAYGMDFSAPMITLAEERISHHEGCQRAHLVNGDIEHIPFQDNLFDLATCIGVLGYLERDDQAIGELFRVLKPGGYLLVNISNMLELAALDFELRRRILAIFNASYRNTRKDTIRGLSKVSQWLEQYSPTHFRFRTYNLWKFDRLMKMTGFQRTDSRTFGYGLRLLRKMRIIPEKPLLKLERWMETCFRKVPLPYFVYSGSTYIGVFRKPRM